MNLTKDDIFLIRLALSHYAQMQFELGIYTRVDGMVDVKETHHELVKRCDEIIDKLSKQ